MSGSGARKSNLFAPAEELLKPQCLGLHSAQQAACKLLWPLSGCSHYCCRDDLGAEVQPAVAATAQHYTRYCSSRGWGICKQQAATGCCCILPNTGPLSRRPQLCACVAWLPLRQQAALSCSHSSKCTGQNQNTFPLPMRHMQRQITA